MKILFVLHEARLTGAPIALFELVEWLAKNTKIKMSFLLLDSGELMEKLKDIGTIYYWPTHYLGKKNNLFNRILNRIYNVGENTLLQKIKNENFDILYFNTIICSNLIDKTTTFKAIKIWHIHELNIALSKFGKSRIKSHRFVDFLVANSNATKKMLVENGIEKNKVTVIPPSIKSSIIKQLAVAEKIKDINITNNDFIVGTSGYVVNRKGLKEFLELAKKTHEQYPESKIKFIWVGKVLSPLKVKLLNWLNGNRVTFVGSKNNPFPYYARFNVFVSCSHEESFGLAALECAALHKSIICFNDTGGIEELVRNSNNTIIPKFDIDNLSTVIIDLLNNSQKNNYLGEQSLKYSQEFETQKIGKQFYDFLNRNILQNNEPA